MNVSIPYAAKCLNKTSSERSAKRSAVTMLDEWDAISSNLNSTLLLHHPQKSPMARRIPPISEKKKKDQREKDKMRKERCH